MAQYYPFLNSERDRLKSLDLKMGEISEEPIYSASVDNAEKDILGRPGEPGDRDLAIVEFTLAKILLGIIGDDGISRVYAERKAGEYGEKLEHESLTYLIKIAREDFSMDLRTEESLRIHFTDFFRYKPEFLKLSQMNLLGGYVQVTKSQLSWILRGAIRERILEGIPKRGSFPDELKKAAARIKGQRERATKMRRRSAPMITSLDERALPPCIRDIVGALEAGRANHNAHFVLVTFLQGLGLGEGAILDVFRRSPKFKEKTTRYQIRFARERGYTCPACSSIKGYGLCTSECPAKHPVTNYFTNLRGLRSGPQKAESSGGRAENSWERKTGMAGSGGKEARENGQ